MRQFDYATELEAMSAVGGEVSEAVKRCSN